MVEDPGHIAENDYAALVVWYDKEAAQLRQKARDMEQMAKRYQDHPGLVHTEQEDARKTNFAYHCQALAGMYTKAAEEAEELAQENRDMLK